MFERRDVFPVSEHDYAYVGGGDGSMVLDHEIVFVSFTHYTYFSIF
jgi:hypothetical protein